MGGLVRKQVRELIVRLFMVGSLQLISIICSVSPFIAERNIDVEDAVDWKDEDQPDVVTNSKLPMHVDFKPDAHVTAKKAAHAPKAANHGEAKVVSQLQLNASEPEPPGDYNRGPSG